MTGETEMAFFELIMEDFSLFLVLTKHIKMLLIIVVHTPEETKTKLPKQV